MGGPGQHQRLLGPEPIALGRTHDPPVRAVAAKLFEPLFYVFQPCFRLFFRGKLAQRQIDLRAPTLQRNVILIADGFERRGNRIGQRLAQPLGLVERVAASHVPRALIAGRAGMPHDRAAAEDRLLEMPPGHGRKIAADER